MERLVQKASRPEPRRKWVACKVLIIDEVPGGGIRCLPKTFCLASSTPLCFPFSFASLLPTFPPPLPPPLSLTSPPSMSSAPSLRPSLFLLSASDGFASLAARFISPALTLPVPPLHKCSHALQISMVDGVTFDVLEEVARKVRMAGTTSLRSGLKAISRPQVRGVNKPFGGIQLVCVGDFHQLPPVSNKVVPSWQLTSARGRADRRMGIPSARGRGGGLGGGRWCFGC